MDQWKWFEPAVNAFAFSSTAMAVFFLYWRLLYLSNIHACILYSVYFILGFSFLKGEIEELVLDFLKPFRQFHSMCNSFCQLLRPSYGTWLLFDMYILIILWLFLWYNNWIHILVWPCQFLLIFFNFTDILDFLIPYE